jgi:hypothetical protein
MHKATRKQIRAREVNWCKSRLMGAKIAVSATRSKLREHKLLTEATERDLIKANGALTNCLRSWEKEIWNNFT